MSSESPASHFQNLQEGYGRVNERIQRFRQLLSLHPTEIPEFLINELGELESDLQFVADKIGLDIDMESKNIREIESVVAQFIAKNYGASSEQSTQIARYFLTLNQDKEPQPAGSAESAALKAIVTIDVRYKYKDRSTWLRCIDIWHLSDGKPARYNLEASIPRDELPQAVREQSITIDQDELHIRIYPQES